MADNERPQIPPGVDPDQYEQFVQFQRFQEFQRFSGSQPGQQGQQALPGGQPALPAGKGKPAWQTVLLAVLRNKWFHRLVALIVVLLVLNWAYEHYFGGSDSGTAAFVPPAPKTAAGGLNVLSTDIAQTVQNIYGGVADDRPETCVYLSDDAKKQFAALFGGGTCEQTIDRLSKQVTDAGTYVPIPVPRDAIAGTTTVPVSSCKLQITGGPLLGKFTLTRTDGGYLVTSWQSEPAC